MKKMMQTPRPLARIAAQSVEPQGFDLWAANPIAWLDKAQELRRAAALVFDGVTADRAAQIVAIKAGRVHSSVSVSGPWILQLAFMLENLFKGLLVAQSINTPAKRSGKLDEHLKGHILRDLARRASFKLSADEAEFLDLASNATLSWGRYPVPLTHHAFRVGATYNEAAVAQMAEGLYLRIGEALLLATGWSANVGSVALTAAEFVDKLRGKLPVDASDSRDPD